MTSILGIIPRPAFVASRIGLDPGQNPGTVEIIGGIQNVFFASQKTGMSSDDFREGLNSAWDFWGFQVGVVRDFASDIITAETFDPIHGALIGGIDTATMAKHSPQIFWKSDGARKATFIALQSGNVHTAAGFAQANHAVRFNIMATTYCDLSAQAALLDAYPERFTSTPMDKLDGMGAADRLDMPASRLTQAIRDTESAVLRRWRAIYVPPVVKRQPRLRAV